MKLSPANPEDKRRHAARVQIAVGWVLIALLVLIFTLARYAKVIPWRAR